MPRKPRIELPGGLYHVISRGNNRKKDLPLPMTILGSLKLWRPRNRRFAPLGQETVKTVDQRAYFPSVTSINRGVNERYRPFQARVPLSIDPVFRTSVAAALPRFLYALSILN
jgi:hypothetical protein